MARRDQQPPEFVHFLPLPRIARHPASRANSQRSVHARNRPNGTVLTRLKAAANFQLRCKIAIARGYRPKRWIMDHFPHLLHMTTKCLAAEIHISHKPQV